eukprot:TRINITY_DN47662_c0_g1_i1.p1 TRINITY_DN47662_c0_g1~~TRINITY_DN47662_c0_g1_i1.p1  ORF type:complete len:415 (+),score=108.33 TRINITY_DN47662_c0_g1_i1:68-1246(+)
MAEVRLGVRQPSGGPPPASSVGAHKAAASGVFPGGADATVLLAPVGFAAAVAPLAWFVHDPVDTDLPTWVYLLVVILCDVGHVWGTFLRTHLDARHNAARWKTHNVLPAVLFAGLVVVHWVDAAVMWTALGFLAIAQCVRQQWGFVSICRRRKREVDDWGLDCWALCVGMAAPVLLWHCDRHRHFDWFMVEVPLLLGPLPGWVEPVTLLVWCGTLVVYAARQLVLFNNGDCNTWKAWCVGSAWISWGAGLLVPHRVVAILFLTLPHAVPALAVVYYSLHHRWHTRGSHAPRGCGESLSRWLSAPGRVWAFLLTLGAVAAVEEALWESLIWREYTHDVFAIELDHGGQSFAVGLLVLPQATHYCFELLLWDHNWGDIADRWGQKEDPDEPTMF